ncbi:rhodanese domain-containing protein [Caballeronia pedi]|uniref:Rhodanese domain-containing protein n=1 Tax=Caballeronia pedi TaxID=1777141 RepID=A0A158CF45_9BURK|nr:rhodanese-like domain-containing protein [Caballeronia pedi]SAK80945.1 rhodanese domain-containing protein [Caballeronia pedi]
MPLALDAVRFIDASTLRHWLNDGREIALLDVREAGQFGEGHPFFATPLPFSRLELDAPRLLPRANVRIVLLDDGSPAQGASVAQRAAARLRQRGYDDIAILEGGASAWQRAGYTLFRGINVPSKTFGELVEREYGTPHVSAVQLQRWRAERGGCPIALIDGRTPEEHRKMAIPGAVCVPNGELAAHIDAFAGSPDTTIVIHCAGRTRSIIGAQTLRNLGIRRDVFALENGTQGWALAGFELEHGSTRGHAEALPAGSDARARAQALAQRVGVAALDERAARAWLDDATRTTYLLDVRTLAEYARDGLPFAQHAPGGQLVQATDQSVAVRHARLLLVDHDGIRAPVVAHWLVQLGFEAATVDAEIAARLTPREQAQAARDDDASAHPNVADESIVLDLRASAAHEHARPAGSHWTIRPRVFDTLRDAQATHDTPIVLFTDPNARPAARLVADDLRDAGFADVSIVASGIDGWKGAVDRAELHLTPARRIDFLFFVHDRHEGNLDAARAYLAWETGLIAQCAADELAAFRVGEAALLTQP